MPRVKIPRKSTAIDMTAMCDVAFLLLTFFILTAKPKTEDPVHIDSPSSSVDEPLPEKDLATLTVGKGKVFFSIEGEKIRKELLQQMGTKYNVAFTQAEVNSFANLDNVGIPFQYMKQYLDMDPDKRKDVTYATGIPRDTAGTSELYNWMHEARVVTRNLDEKELRFTIKGDSKEEYPTMRDLIAIMQKQQINKFSLITALKKQ